MSKIFVKPNREIVPPHPIDGKLPPDGGNWTADQYTFRLLQDGDIVKVEPQADQPPTKRSRAKAPASDE